MTAGYAAKGGPEFETAEEETAHYSEMDRAHELADQLCAIRAFTLVARRSNRAWRTSPAGSDTARWPPNSRGRSART